MMKKAVSVAVLLILFFWGFWLHFYQLESWPEESERMIRVHVEGSVHEPGVYTLPQSARLEELLIEAGGLLDEADTMRLNLAQRLMDGEKVYIYPKSAEEVGESVTDIVQRYLPTDRESWLAIPGIGPATAKNIIAYLELNPSASIDDLIEVSGIGPAKLALIREYFDE